jgi:NitT/TauT family transport system permease protein
VNRTTRGSWTILFLQALPGIVLIAFWQWASGRLVDPMFFSRPSAIVLRVVELLGDRRFWGDVQITVIETALGYLIGAGLGLVLAFMAGRSETFRKIVEPYIIAINSVPKVALAPLFILWFGVGIWSKVWTAVILVFFLVFYNTFLGISTMDRELASLARVMGSSERQVVTLIVLPATLPFVMAGLRTSVPYAIIGVILGEFAASTKGLGYKILYAANTFDASTLYAGILVLLAFVLLTNALIGGLERRLVRWKPREDARPGL